jgi:hypothetical protein
MILEVLSVTGIGIDAAAKISYRLESVYFNKLNLCRC